MQKLISVSLVILMVLVLGIAPAFAEATEGTRPEMGNPPQEGQMQGGGQRGGRQPEGMTEGEIPPEKPEGAADMGTPPELPEGAEEGTEPRRGGGKGMGQMEGDMGMGMLNIDEVKTAVSELSDTDAQTSVMALIEAYEAAMTAEKDVMDSKGDETAMTSARTTVEEARAALEEALTALGLDITAFSFDPEGILEMGANNG